jgi:hypothetical protein
MATRKKRAPAAGGRKRAVSPTQFKRASETVLREMEAIKQLAEARTSALDDAIQELARQGVRAVPRVLSTYGQHLTPEERELLERATDRDIEKLVQMAAVLKDLDSSMRCI